MAQRGFVVNTADVAGITTAYDATKAVKLIGRPLVDPPAAGATIADVRGRPVPIDFIADSIEGHCEVTGGAPTKVYVRLAWDSNGDYFFTNEVEIDLPVGITTAAKRSFNADIDVHRVFPDDSDTLIAAIELGAVYAFLKTDAGTVTVKRLLMYWQREGR